MFIILINLLKNWRKMFSIFCLAVASILEFFGLYINIFSNTLSNVYFYLFLHLIASFLVSLAIAPLFSIKKVENKIPIIVTSTILFFLTTFIGFIFSLIIFIYLMKRQRHNIDIYLDSLDSKNIEILSKSKRQFGEGTISTYNTDLPASSKYGILSLVSNLRFPNMGNVIKRSLEDDNDEIRLFAFNILSKEENFINNELKKRLEKLENNNDNKSEKSIILKEIGILYWELLYLDLVDNELNNYYLSLSEKYLKEALLSNQNDYETFLYLGRICLKRKEYDFALDYLQKVIELNEKEKAMPYMAEIYFNLKKYKEAKSLLSSLSKTEIHPNFYSNYCAWVNNE